MEKQEPEYIELKDNNLVIRLRKSLFWDISPEKIDLNNNRKLIIERVISRGTMDEYQQIIRFYGKNKILETAKRIKSFDKKTRNFISLFIQA